MGQHTAAHGGQDRIADRQDDTDTDTVPAASTRPARRLALAILAGTTVVAVVADAVTKYLVTSHLSGHPPVRLLGGVLYLDVVRNGGAAFSLGTGYTWVFPVAALIVTGCVCWLARRLRSLGWAVSLGLVLGGAMGNLGDRLFRAPGFMVGHVVDFISAFGPNAEYWPIFNLADTSLFCGVALAILLELSGRRRDGSRAAQAVGRGAQASRGAEEGRGAGASGGAGDGHADAQMRADADEGESRVDAGDSRDNDQR